MEQLPEVIEADLSFTTGKLIIQTPPQYDPTGLVMERVKAMGYSIDAETRPADAEPVKQDSRSQPASLLAHSYFIPMLVAGVALLLALLLAGAGIDSQWVRLIYWLGIAAGVAGPAKSGWATLRTVRELDMNALMVIAVAGATIIGEYHEALAVVFLFALGNFLQVYTFDRTRQSIRRLMNLTPQEALVRRDGTEQILPVVDIRCGDTVLIRPGESVPVDGKVIMGNSAVNQAPITGESVPVFKQAGDEVFAGTTNGNGFLEVTVTKEFYDTAIQRIIVMVEEAQAQKAPSQQLIDRFARYYTPVVILLAGLVVIVPTWVLGHPFQYWLYQGLAMLLVACPCALVISTPVSIVSAIGNAARQGVLIKGGSHLEELGRIEVMAFDKTGTLTEGHLEVSDAIAVNGRSANEFLALAAGIELRSEHPVAGAVVRSAKARGLVIPTPERFSAVPGKGARASIGDREYLVGNLRFMEENRIHTAEVIDLLSRLEQEGKTVVMVADQNQAIGLIAVRDRPRLHSAAIVQNLHRLGIKKTVMLTGDNTRVASALAQQIGLKSVSADLLPEDKVQVIEDLLAQYDRVAMVGDGVNDAPALARATVGIAMGSAGTDAALQTADVALMSDDLSKLPFAIGLSRQTVRIIRQNIWASLLVKAVILLLVVPGLLTMWLAVIGDVGTSLLVTLNGMRLLKLTPSQS